MPDPIIITEPGIYELTNEEYHSAVAFCPLTGRNEKPISKSGLVKGSRSWAHFKSAMDNPKKPKPGMIYGTDGHTGLLEYGRWKEEKQAWFDSHKMKPAFTGEGSAKRRKEWEAIAKAEGKKGQTWTEWEAKKEYFKKVEALRTAVLGLAPARELLRYGTAELSFFWFDEVLQIWMKCRPDWLMPNGHYVEFKTSTDTRPRKFGYTSSDFLYHWHVFYLDIMTNVTGFPHDKLTIIAAESEPPHWPMIFPIVPYIDRNGRHIDPLLIGRIQYRKKLLEYTECLKTDTWPGYPMNDEPLKFSPSALWVSEEDWEEYYNGEAEMVEIDFDGEG